MKEGISSLSELLPVPPGDKRLKPLGKRRVKHASARSLRAQKSLVAGEADGGGSALPHVERDDARPSGPRPPRAARPWARQASPTALTGRTVPQTLLACVITTSRVRGLMRRSTSAALRVPSWAHCAR